MYQAIITICCNENPHMLSNVFALITIFRKGELFSHQLPVTGIERIAEFDNLVSGVINIKLPGDIIAGPIGYCCQDIADRAASGIASFDELMATAQAKAPLQRLVTLEEIASLSAFLCTDAASGMTGQTIYVDAGAHIVA